MVQDSWSVVSRVVLYKMDLWVPSILGLFVDETVAIDVFNESQIYRSDLGNHPFRLIKCIHSLQIITGSLFDLQVSKDSLFNSPLKRVLEVVNLKCVTKVCTSDNRGGGRR